MAAKTPRLTEVQRYAIRAGSPRQWLGCRETNVTGYTMDALARRGLAEVKAERPEWSRGGRMLYRLTPAGNDLRVEWAINAANAPVQHIPIRVRCTHCSAEFPDGTPGGSCGACGLEVEALT